MLDVILSIAIFHSLCALTLIAAVSMTAFFGKRRPARTRRLPVIARAFRGPEGHADGQDELRQPARRGLTQRQARFRGPVSARRRPATAAACSTARPGTRPARP